MNALVLMYAFTVLMFVFYCHEDVDVCIYSTCAFFLLS